MEEFITEQLESVSKKVRQLIIEVANRSKTAHVGSSLSCVELLVTLYFHLLHIEKEDWDKRDIFILSKGHAAMALYCVFAQKKFIDQDTLLGYLQNNGTLPAHLDRFTIPEIEASVGALGHGFNMALGLAHGLRLKGDKRKVVALIGDGESEEGSIWEGAMFGAKLGLDNLTAFVDYNNLQGYGRPRDICQFEPIIDKWQAFGWDTCIVDGHNFFEITHAFQREPAGKPRAIIARTIKGKGVSFMENELKWHYFIVTDELKAQALKEL